MQKSFTEMTDTVHCGGCDEDKPASAYTQSALRARGRVMRMCRVCRQRHTVKLQVERKYTHKTPTPWVRIRNEVKRHCGGVDVQPDVLETVVTEVLGCRTIDGAKRSPHEITLRRIDTDRRFSVVDNCVAYQRRFASMLSGSEGLLELTEAGRDKARKMLKPAAEDAV